MIITLIVLAIIIIGIILVCVSKHTDSWTVEEWTNFVGWLLIVMGIVFSLFTVGFIIGNASTCELNYQNTLHKKEMLEYRIKHIEDNITGNEMLYNDIVEFNNELRNTKKWANNPWTNWFNNQDVASIDYIELNSN